MATSASLFPSPVLFPNRNPNRTLTASNTRPRFRRSSSNRTFRPQRFHISEWGSVHSRRLRSATGNEISTLPSNSRDYEFSDCLSEVELRLDLSDTNVENTRDIFIDTDEFSLRVRVRTSSSIVTLLQTSQLYDRIRPSETIWYIDEDQLVISLKKFDTNLKWPDLVENWFSLTIGVPQLLKGTSIYIVGNSTMINQMVARELASGIRYIPLITSELLEDYAKQPLDSWVTAEGQDSVAGAECAILENLSSYVRTVVATLGGEQGMAGRSDKWRHLYAGITVWLSPSEATDEASAREEARRNIEVDSLAYSNAEVVVKLGGWEAESAQAVAQACLTAIKRLLLSDKELVGKKNLYIRSGCRGDWPNIEIPGWDPSTATKQI